IAYRLGRMIAAGWLARADVEAALIEAMNANGAVADDGIKSVEATLRAGIEAGMAEPYPGLAEADPEPQNCTHVHDAPQHPRSTLAEVHAVCRRWFGPGYDTDVIDAVMAAGAAEQLAGDPLWLLVISGPGNTKTESVQSLAGAGAHVTSTI